MKVEIIAIASEVLSGFIINTNAATISKELLKIGISTTKHTVLPDEETIFKKGLRNAIAENDIVICTGGLGPTCDDNTRQWISEIFDSKLIFNNEVASFLRNKYGENLLTLKNQATVPNNAKLILNQLGTAPGLIFRKENKSIYFLPGVPYEMEDMLKNEVLAELKEIAKSHKKTYSKWIYFTQIIEAQLDPYIKELQTKIPDIQYGIYPGRGKISLRIFIQSSDKKEAELKINQALHSIRKNFQQFEYESPSGSLEEAIHYLFIQKKLRLSIAESCTGGSIAARLTLIPGSSQYFDGSIVCYSNEYKSNILNVSKKTLESHGAVSKETVKEMILGLLSISDSDVGIAVTGIAGPDGGTVDKPVGTVWCALQFKDNEPLIWKIETDGTRAMIIDYTINTILGKLYHLLIKRD